MLLRSHVQVPGLKKWGLVGCFIVSCMLLAGGSTAVVRAESDVAPAGAPVTEIVVVAGDTLYSLARKHEVTVDAIKTFNQLTSDAIRVGQRLRIPPPRTAQADPRPMGSQGPAVGASNLTERPTIPWSEEELSLLARLIDAEAGNEPFLGQVAVGAVVVNRVLNSNFPNSVTAVIMQPGQFKVVELGRLNRTASPSAIDAARMALSGVDSTGGALYFFNPDRTEAWNFWQSRTVIRTIGLHAFAL